MITSAHTPEWANATHTAVKLMVAHDVYGEILFIASTNDCEQHGVELFNSAVAGQFGPIAPYVAPPVVIPSSVTMRQARLALLSVGLLPTVNAAIAAMTGTAGEAARIEWEFARTVDRNSPIIASLAIGLNLSSDLLDALFTAAASM